MGMMENFSERIYAIKIAQRRLQEEFLEIENRIDLDARRIAHNVIDGLQNTLDGCVIARALDCPMVGINWNAERVTFAYCPNLDDHPNDQEHFEYSIPFWALDCPGDWITLERRRISGK
jgi:hypothetical protein